MLECLNLQTFNLLTDISIKTTALARVTCRTRRIDQNQQRIRITVHADFDHALNISRGRALMPQLLTTA